MTRTFNTRLVTKTLGALLMILAVFMLMPTAVAYLYGESEEFMVFLYVTGFTFLVGLIALLIGVKASPHVSEREGYVIVAFVWIVFSLFGMLPYYFTGTMNTITEAWFETMSGFTTTGATNIADLTIVSHSILFWRSLTQWLGGMGIVVLSLALLPMFGLGGMQLYAAEVTGLSYEKVAPRISDTARRMWILYVVLTLAEILLLWVEGMDIFDAVCHSFTTIATGGFSTNNLSLFDYSPAIQYTIAIFMLLSGLNFALLFYLLIGKPKRLLQDEETHWYLGAVGIATIVLSIGLFVFVRNYSVEGAEEAFRNGFFMSISAITTTGFAISDYTQWAPLLWVVTFFCMFTGASAGSTSGGIKWVRLAIVAKYGLTEFKRRIHPNAVIPVKLNKKPIDQRTTGNVMAFMMFYILIILITVLIFSACGINFEEAIGTTICAIGNVGVSIGQYGPMGTYADFPIVAKWVLSFVMLIGRLEIFTILLLFTRALWKK